MSENTKKPYSYFFTDLSLFNQNDKAFGPEDASNFQITTKFGGALPAYAVTDGLLFFAKCGNTDPNKINILLKPTKDVGLGFKIKYFVYRGIDKSDFFSKVGGVDVVNPSSPLPFVKAAWDSYVEFYGSSDDFKASKLGLDVSGIPTQDILKMFFPKDSYNLLYVNGGKQIGKFLAGAGGFEIVLDEGDFIQGNPDTGLTFDKGFAEAEECILKVNGPYSNYIFGGNTTGINAKIFRENVYKFIDPAAFYGLHSKEIYYNDGSVAETGVKTFNGSRFNTNAEIYSNIISKFKNQDKIYFYIKNNLNRNIQFYNEDNVIKINGTTEKINDPTASNKSMGWPIIIYQAQSDILLNITDSSLNVMENFRSNIYSNLTFKSDVFSISSNIIAESVGAYKIIFPKDSYNKIYTSLVFITQNSKDYDFDHVFGPAILNTIFEEADFSGGKNKISWVNHLRNILVRKGSELGIYNTKVILDYTNSTNAAQKLRTFFVAPVASSIQNNASFTEKVDSKYMTSGYIKEEIGNSSDFCQKVLGQENAEIWRGEIKEGTTTINSLVFRKDENIDNHPVFMLGLTEQDLDTLKMSLPVDATNVFIKLGPNIAGPDDHLYFAKYNAVLSYDNSTGVRVADSNSVVFYSIDNQFFFTKLYSANFPNKYCSEFADITVDFRPQNRWMQYFNYPLTETKTTLNVPSVFYGFDWLRKGDSERKGKAGDTLGPTENILMYKISEYFKRPPVSAPKEYNSFFDNIADNPNGDDSNAAISRKDLYVNVKGMYRVIPVKWKLSHGDLFSGFSTTQTEPNDKYDKDYAPSWLNIPRKGNTNSSVKLRLKVRLNNSSAKTDLKLCFDKKLFRIKTLGSLTGAALAANTSKVIPNNVNVRKSKDQEIGAIKFKLSDLPSGGSGSTPYMNWLDFELENIAGISELSIISVWSGNKLAGKLYVVPNQNLVTKNVLIIKVQDVSETIKGNYNTNEVKLMEKFALQSNIVVNAQDLPTDFKLFDDDPFINFTSGGVINYNIKQNGETFIQYLNRKFTEKYPQNYKNYTKVFYFSLKPINAGTLGQTYRDEGIICMFDYDNKYKRWDTTEYFYALAHEYLHSQGISHTFSGMDKDEGDALLTFMKGTTNNVMDYSNDDFDYPVTLNFIQSSFFWQWAIANKYSKQNK